jgi:hypothetical protein
MEWNSTAKEITESGFFIAMDKIMKDYKYTYIIIIIMTAVLIYFGLYAPMGYIIPAPTVIVPVANQLVCHALLPIALGMY